MNTQLKVRAKTEVAWRAFEDAITFLLAPIIKGKQLTLVDTNVGFQLTTDQETAEAIADLLRWHRLPITFELTALVSH